MLHPQRLEDPFLHVLLELHSSGARGDVATERCAVVGVGRHGTRRINAGGDAVLERVAERLHLGDVLDQQIEQRFFEAGRVRQQVTQLDRLLRRNLRS